MPNQLIPNQIWGGYSHQTWSYAHWGVYTYLEWGSDKVINFMSGINLRCEPISGLPAIWIEQLYTDIAAAVKLPLEDLLQLLVTEKIEHPFIDLVKATSKEEVKASSEDMIDLLLCGDNKPSQSNTTTTPSKTYYKILLRGNINFPFHNDLHVVFNNIIGTIIFSAMICTKIFGNDITYPLPSIVSFDDTLEKSNFTRVKKYKF